MFCPVCGAKITEGSAFCDNCGNKITENQSTPIVPQAPEQPVVETEQSVQAPPTMNMPPMPVYANQPKLKKGKYIQQLGSKKIKNLSKIVWATLLAFVIVLGLGTYNIVGSGFFDIPVVTMIISENNINKISEVADGADEIFDKAEEALDDVKGEISDEEFKMLKGFLKDGRDLVSTPSIANIKKMMSRFEDVSEMATKYTGNDQLKEIKEKIDSVDIVSEMTEPMKYINIAIYALFGFAGFIALLMLLATALKSIGLTILSLLLSAPIFYFIAGPVYCVLAAIIVIAMIVMFTIINKEYKKYRKSI